jgi:hypothetical protein
MEHYMKKLLLAALAIIALSSCASITEKLVPMETGDTLVRVRHGKVIAYVINKDFSLQLFFVGTTDYHTTFYLGIQNNKGSPIIATRLSDFQLDYIEPEDYISGYQYRNDPGELTTLHCLYENECLKAYEYTSSFSFYRSFLSDYYYKNHDLLPEEYHSGRISFDRVGSPVKNITVKLTINGTLYAIDFKRVDENWFPDKPTEHLDNPLFDLFPDNIVENRPPNSRDPGA